MLITKYHSYMVGLYEFHAVLEFRIGFPFLGKLRYHPDISDFSRTEFFRLEFFQLVLNDLPLRPCCLLLSNDYLNLLVQYRERNGGPP